MDIECECEFCKTKITKKTFPSMEWIKVRFCSPKCKADYQRLRKPVTKEWLHEHYVTKKMGCGEIAKLVSRDAKSVYNWLKDFKIPTRKRGEVDNGHRLKKGVQSPFSGRKHTQETREKLRKIAIEQGRVPFNKEVGPPFRGKRGSETPNWKGGITPERQSFYLSQEWKDVSRQVWKRDAAKCQRCGCIVGREKNSFAIHHIISFAVKEFRASLENLVLVCRPCHLWIHSLKNTEKEFIRDASK